MLELNDIGLSVEAVRRGSFWEAARPLGMRPNAVSRHIDQLEQELGVWLMQRSTRRLTLTDAGHDLFGRCAAAVDGLQQASQDTIAGVLTPSGLVLVAAPANFFDYCRMERVAEFLAAHPPVRLHFVLNDATADLIAHGIDAAIRARETRTPNYVMRRLHSHPIGLVASPAYLAERGTPAELQELAHHDCVTSSSPRNQANWRLRDPDGVEKEVVVSGRITANKAQALCRATLNGLGIALLPAMVVADVTAGRLVLVLPRYQRSDPGVIVVYPSRRHLPWRCLHSSARDFTGRVNVRMAGVNIPIPAPIACHSFGGWKRSGFGDLNQHRPDSVRFYTKTKTVTSPWPSGVKDDVEFVIPTTR